MNKPSYFIFSVALYAVVTSVSSFCLALGEMPYDFTIPKFGENFVFAFNLLLALPFSLLLPFAPMVMVALVFLRFFFWWRIYTGFVNAKDDKLGNLKLKCIIDLLYSSINFGLSFIAFEAMKMF